MTVGGVSLTPAQIRSARESNDRRFRGWKPDRVVRLHKRTVASASSPAVAAEYVASVRAHLASGLYRAIYPPHVVEATRAWLASVR